MNWDKFKTTLKNILKALAIPFIVIGVFFIKGFSKYKDDKIKEDIKQTESKIDELQDEVKKAHEDFSKKQEDLDKSLSQTEKTLDDLKRRKEERDKSSEKFFK